MTEETTDAVVTSGAVEASGSGAIVNILRTIRSRPAVDTNARISAMGVGARGAVLANTRPKGAFVHILIAIRSGERWRALARVQIDSVDASRSVLTQMSRTIVDVLLAIRTTETFISFSNIRREKKRRGEKKTRISIQA